MRASMKDRDLLIDGSLSICAILPDFLSYFHRNMLLYYVGFFCASTCTI